MYLGITLTIISSLFIIWAGVLQLFWLLVVGRFFMALGSSAGLMIAFTVIGDVYQHEQATKKISYLILAFAVGPGLAVAIGGFLTQYFGWESCFYFLAGYGALLFIRMLSFQETCPQKDHHALRFQKITEGYLQKLKNKKVLFCSLMLGCTTLASISSLQKLHLLP